VRRAVVVCESRTQTEAKYGAANLQSIQSVKGEPEATRAGLTFSKGAGVLPNSYESTIILPKDRITEEILRAGATPAYSAIETLVHEAFHSTQVDVYGSTEHERRERIRFSIAAPCEQSSLDDVVSFVTSLCTGMSLTSSSNSAEDALDLRMNNCGSSCAKQFEPLAKRLAHEEHLSTASAAATLAPACAKISARAQCTRDSDLRASVLTNLNDKIRDLSFRLNQRVYGVFSSISYMVSGQYLELEPGVRAVMKRLEGCSRIHPYPQGGYLIAGPGNPTDGQGLKVAISRARDALQRIKETLPACGIAGAEAASFVAELDQAASRLVSPFGSRALEEVIGETAIGWPEFRAGLTQALQRDPSLLGEKADVSARILGPELQEIRAIAPRLLQPLTPLSCE
jgi:hypothetical protein